MNLTIDVPRGFNFWLTVYSHGWCSLPPFQVLKEEGRLRRICNLTGDKPVTVEIYQEKSSQLTIALPTLQSLIAEGKHKLVLQVRTLFRLDEDFSEFYSTVRKHPGFRWVAKSGAGRLLRAPTVFEDVVKMICTTNCSWALTTILTTNLCQKLGRKTHDGQYTFPGPEAIADRSEKFLRKEIRAGYRAPYLLELSKRVINKDIHLDSWRASSMTTDELYHEVRSVKGVGPYAAGNILKLLGRYDYLAIDSWCRKKFFELHKNGKSRSDATIEKFYAPFGKWQGLYFWMDVTKDWYNKKFPF